MITTERLLLRPWKDEDFPPYAEMNADTAVREFFPSLLTREESDAEIRRFQGAYERDGFCMFASELIATGQFAGFVGLQTMNFVVPCIAQPAVEIGWRLSRAHWGIGLATEGTRGVIRHAFETLQLCELVAITVPANLRSRRVMEKIGMKHFPELNFEHPRIPPWPPVRSASPVRLRQGCCFLGPWQSRPSLLNLMRNEKNRGRTPGSAEVSVTELSQRVSMRCLSSE